MGPGEQRLRPTSRNIMRPRLLVSAALAALVVAAPTGEPTARLAMNLGSGFATSRFKEPVHLNNVPREPTGRLGNTKIGNGHVIGVLGRGDSGNGSGNPCKLTRNRSERCVGNNGGDHPGSDPPGGGRRPAWRAGSAPPQ